MPPAPEKPIWKYYEAPVKPTEDRAPTGSCEFAGAAVDATCKGRHCADSLFCPQSIFFNREVFVLCPIRQEKLKEQTP